MEAIILVIHLVIVVAMVLTILIQRTSNDSLSGLSGGGGGGNALFSVRGKANLLTKATSYLAIGFLITSLTLAYLATHKKSDSLVDKLATEKTAPLAAEPAKPAAPAVPLAK